MSGSGAGSGTPTATLIHCGLMPLHFDDYIALCEDPDTGQQATFRIRAVSASHADKEARHGWFGLLAPPPEEKFNALKVDVAKV